MDADLRSPMGPQWNPILVVVNICPHAGLGVSMDSLELSSAESVVCVLDVHGCVRRPRFARSIAARCSGTFRWARKNGRHVPFCADKPRAAPCCCVAAEELACFARRVSFIGVRHVS